MTWPRLIHSICALLLVLGCGKLSEGPPVAETLEGLPPAELETWKSRTKFTRPMDEKYVGAAGNYGNPALYDPKLGEKIIEKTVESGITLLEALAGRVEK